MDIDQVLEVLDDQAREQQTRGQEQQKLEQELLGSEYSKPPSERADPTSLRRGGPRPGRLRDRKELAAPNLPIVDEDAHTAGASRD